MYRRLLTDNIIIEYKKILTRGLKKGWGVPRISMGEFTPNEK
tara:strand:- start:66 stop:191 length:126 start_codon:yes stop_codon:yes gene_type:complete